MVIVVSTIGILQVVLSYLGSASGECGGHRQRAGAGGAVKITRTGRTPVMALASVHLRHVGGVVR
jgi:hypothetical protein